ncbi:TetR/AcrR family transcriptional regulator [Rhodococcus sp. X156]|uniref:TetR/AcrR family transcriptional regulator n=1 Tax=Rhodococcus sp. X156 TaxID=2499145 RepID=UPI0013E3F4BA|nr:TetR/AcrR family transcriptional regulator [Rhodococcus sp. X156]
MRQTREEVLGEIRARTLELVATQGYEATTLQEIAASVGYSKSALLYHFASKEALVAQALLEPLQRMQEYLAVAAHTDRAQQASDLVRLIVSHRYEVFLMLRHGERLHQLEPALRLDEYTDRVRALFCGPGAGLAEEVAVRVAITGVAETAMVLLDVPDEELGPALLAAALPVLAPGSAAPDPSAPDRSAPDPAAPAPTRA